MFTLSAAGTPCVGEHLGDDFAIWTVLDVRGASRNSMSNCHHFSDGLRVLLLVITAVRRLGRRSRTVIVSGAPGGSEDFGDHLANRAVLDV